MIAAVLRIAVAVTVGLFLFDLAAPVSQAHAQGAQMRTQTRTQTNAVSRNLRQAMRPKLEVRNSAGPIVAESLDKSGKYLAIASADNLVRVWDLEAGRAVHRCGIGGAVLSIAIDGLSGRAILGGATGTLEVCDFNAGAEAVQLKGHTGPVHALRVSQNGRLLLSGSEDRTARIWDLADRRELLVLQGHAGPIRAVDFTDDGSYAITGSDDGTVRIWAVATGATQQTLGKHDGPVLAVAAGLEPTLLSGDAAGNLYSWNMQGGQLQKKQKALSGRLTALQVSRTEGLAATAGDGRVKIWKADGLQMLKEIAERDVKLANMVFTPDGRHVIAGSEDGRARVFDAKDGKPVAELIATTQGWAVKDADGRYDGSAGGVADVAWKTDQETLPIDNFSQAYFEPGLLAKRMRQPDALITKGVAPVEEGVGIPPVITLSAGASSGSGPRTKREIAVLADDRGGGLDDLALFHNNKRVPDAALVRTDNTVRDGRARRAVVYAVELLPGANLFSGRAASADRIEGLPAELIIAGPQDKAQGVLHVVAIGVNKYADPDYALTYSVPDARALVKWATGPSLDGFARTQVYELYDEKATRANIVAELKKLQKSDPADMVLIYFAGHGLTEGQEWYFLPQEFGKNGADAAALQSQGLASAQLREALAEIPAQRMFVMLDTCQSGAMIVAFGSDIDRKKMTEVARQTGVHLLAATDKQQQAVEVIKLGHGAMTYSLLRGAEGQADTRPRDGNITVRELLTFLAEAVPELTMKHAQYRQFPTAYSRGVDFRLASPTTSTTR